MGPEVSVAIQGLSLFRGVVMQRFHYIPASPYSQVIYPFPYSPLLLEMAVMKFSIFVVVLATLFKGSFQQNSTKILGSCKEVKSDQPWVVVPLSDLLSVMCDTQTDEGGWLVILRRTTGKLRFYRAWGDYVYGFGDVDGGEFWLGLEWIYRLTYHRKYELRVDMKYKNKNYFAKYGNFRVLSSKEKYKLVLTDFDKSSTAEDNFRYANNMGFTTKDQDNDGSRYNCAERYNSAGWFKQCQLANPFGNWAETKFGQGINWLSVTGHKASLDFIEMKIRPLD